MTRGQRLPRTVLINRKAVSPRKFERWLFSLLVFENFCLSAELFIILYYTQQQREGMSEVKVHVAFSGGAELLVGKVKDHDIILPNKPHPWLLRHLIAWIRDNLLKVKI